MAYWSWLGQGVAIVSSISKEVHIVSSFSKGVTIILFIQVQFNLKQTLILEVHLWQVHNIILIFSFLGFNHRVFLHFCQVPIY